MINNKKANNLESTEKDYKDIDQKIKEKKLEIVNELLRTLKFKNKKNEFTDKVLKSDKFKEKCEEALEECKLFNDKSVLPLFEMKKTNLKTQKSIMGFINSVLKNYGIKIKSIQTNKRDENKKLIMKYEIEQENFIY